MALIRDDAPTPGSAAAISLGCTCDPEANHYGRKPPVGEASWILTNNCPVHPDLIHED